MLSQYLNFKVDTSVGLLIQGWLEMQIKFEGDATTVKGLYRFLKKHAAIPFALPKPAPKSKDPIQLKDEL